MDTIKHNGKDIPVLNARVTTTIKHKETGEIYKTEEEWKAKGIEEKDIRRDVHVLMPRLDLFGKTK